MNAYVIDCHEEDKAFDTERAEIRAIDNDEVKITRITYLCTCNSVINGHIALYDKPKFAHIAF